MLPDPLGPIDLDRPRRRGRPNPEWVASKGRRTVNPNHARFESSVDRARAQGRQCEVAGCHRGTEDFGRWCQYHRDRRRKTGSAEGRQLKRKWLAPWAAEATAYLDQIRRMPDDTIPRQQMALAGFWLRRWFNQADGFETLYYRPGQPLDLRTKRWVGNLIRHDGTPEKTLALVVAMLCYRDACPGAFEDAAHFNHQLAKIVMGTCPRKPAWAGGGPEIMGYRLGQHIGSMLIKHLGSFAAFTASALLGNATAGWPVPEPVRITKAALTEAVRRPNYRPLDDSPDDD